MIIDFSVSNFRSIKEKQTLSLFAEGASKHLPGNIAYPAGKKIGVLRTAGIYGANASGKSNWLLAFKALKYLVLTSGENKDGDLIDCYEPYLLSESTQTAPVSFEIEFSLNQNRYVYEISFNEKEIITESLNYFPGKQPANIFQKKEMQSWEQISFGTKYTGGKKRYALFNNNSYLSKAGNSADSPEIIREVFNYIRKNLTILDHDQDLKLYKWRDDENTVKKVSTILSKVDTGISDIEFHIDNEFEIDFPEDMPDHIINKIKNDVKHKTFFLHTGNDGESVKLPERMESAGTIKLYNILPLLILTFKTGGILILDELDNSFHPHLAELIIKLFNSPSVNKNDAQLIFSTHNINLMTPEILRRDQVWFTEKESGATTLTSLDEFDKKVVKTNTPFGKWYDEGRLGAIPKIDFGVIASILSGEAV